MKKTIIKTADLRKNYTTGDSDVQVIKNLNVEFYQGEFSVIMGNSGSGKSTLLYLLSGLDNISAGKIWLNDESIHEKSEKWLALLRRKKIGFVFQDHNLIPNLSLIENILLAGYLLEENRKIIYNRALKIMEDLEIESLANRLPAQVSGGERQRCAIARALINKPLVLLADEPTGSLNSAASVKALDCLKKLHAAGQTIIMVTHDLKTACYGDRISFFRDGQIVDDLYFDNEKQTGARESLLFNWLKEKGW
ncbi:MAG: ABC transporter ATP-binding protein [Bacteroidales bacterium]